MARREIRAGGVSRREFAREGRDAVLKKRGSKRNLGDGDIFAPRAPAPRFPHWTT
jgi:hypothetical protein